MLHRQCSPIVGQPLHLVHGSAKGLRTIILNKPIWAEPGDAALSIAPEGFDSLGKVFRPIRVILIPQDISPAFRRNLITRARASYG